MRVLCKNKNAGEKNMFLPYMLVRSGWAGHDASGYMWEQLDNLTNCEKAIATFDGPRAAPAPPRSATAGRRSSTLPAPAGRVNCGPCAPGRF